MSTSTSHIDTFARDALPDLDLQADCIFNLDALQFPARLNCATELLDNKISSGLSDKVAIRAAGINWTYQQLLEKANQIAHVLEDDMGLKTGNRVLLRAPNNPMLAACWLAVIKAGGVVVATMPLLRALDLEPIINKAEIEFALCDERLKDELFDVQKLCPDLKTIYLFDGTDNSNPDTELEQKMQAKSSDFNNVDTANDDIALIAFTSGTTGQPKGTMHYHRDVMAMCYCVADELIKPTSDDIFIASPPLAFTFGLGVSLVFPLHAGASVVLLETPTPDNLAQAISEFGATICSTAPTGYRALMNKDKDYDLSSLKKSISAGEHLPLPTFEQWQEMTGLKIIDGLGATEMIHIFVSSEGKDIRPGAIGKALPGYECQIVKDDNSPAACGEKGKLLVRGPTSCKYMADERQGNYIIDGWNFSGDICHMDEDGYVFYHGRSDDMIVSSGYNISGPEVEAALLSHEAVVECAVVSAANLDRGTIVKAFVVLNEQYEGSTELIQNLQDHVKNLIAPYKYPRAIEFITSLPKTQTGKIQRHKLRNS
jgi:2-aminobenzoate-CoA ligase